MKNFLFLLLPFLLLLLLSPKTTSAAVAHCGPNAITSATIYTNYQVVGDTFIAFTYDVNDTLVGACYPTSASENISFALALTTDVYGTNALEVKDAFPAALPASDVNIIHGSNWMSSGFTAVQAADWSSFFFEVNLGRVGLPGRLEVRLYEAVGGGSFLPDVSSTNNLRGFGSFNGDNLNTVVSTVRVYLDSGPTLAAGTNNYVLVLSAPDGDITNHVIWRVTTGTGSIGGSSADGGGTWGAIAGGVHPQTEWTGRTLDTFLYGEIVVEYLQDSFLAGQSQGALYWPADITPTSDHDTSVPNYMLLILNEPAPLSSLTPTTVIQPDVVYRLTDACQIIRVEVLPDGFSIGPLSDFTGASETAAEGIPFLDLLMGESNSLAANLGVDSVTAFLILTLGFSLLLVVAISFYTRQMLVLVLAALLPVVFMTMQGFIHGAALLFVGVFVVLVLAWKYMIKQDA